MSDLLNQASLVMIPSGYKEDIVYSEIPIDGSGDLTLTRASNGTRVNSAGLVEVCPWNLIEQSETFDNASWVKQSSTITANTTTAPNGTTTADTLNATTAQYSGIYQSLGTLPTNVYTYSIYAKAGTNSFVYLLGQGNPSQIAIFNLSTGVITSTSNVDSASIENVGNGWYRCQIQKTGTGVEMFVGFSNIANTTPTASGTVFIWGAQFNIGSTAKPYFPTTDRLNVPRFTYQNGGGGCPSLLLEKQSTNLALYSEQFDNADWSKIGSTITANATISPDGTQNADKLIEDTSTGNHRIVNTAFAVNNGNAHSQSWYVKYFNNQWIQLNRGQEGSGYLNFDLINGVVGYTGGITDYQISNMANGWYRISINYVVTGTYATAGISILDTNVNARYESYVGDGTSGVYIWGCQYEQSSYPTSYIPTTSSSATRVADACFKTGISSLIGQTEGVLFIDFVWNQLTGTGSYPRIIEAWNNGNNYIQLFNVAGTASVYYEIANGGSIQFSGNTTMNLGRNKLALAYKLNDCVFYKNGALIASDTSATIPATNDLGICGTYNGSSGAQLSASVNQAILFPTRLTNAELASLTTI